MNNEENLAKIRHSLAHLLAAAVLEFYPDALPTIGPAIDDGFYYDFDFKESFSDKELSKIEHKMREILKGWNVFSHEEVSEKDAKKRFKNNPFKFELIDEIVEKGEKITLYTAGTFTDLCRGGHVENPSKEIHSNAFKLSRTAGAYWRGDEKNKMLTRIYGFAFASKDELEAHEKMMVEAEKRDHKKLGKELKLFMFHETSPGMPYWLPNGVLLYNTLIDFWRKEHAKLGYQEISSPLVNKAELWKISGHWDHYKDDMFIADMGKNEVYGLKPMNCPNAMVVFQSMQVSYKDLPLRLSDTDRLHRYERSGTLNGLFRVRSFQQDDSHNFISEDQISAEYDHIFEMCKKFYNIFNLEYSFRLCTRPKQFLGEIALWDKAEKALREILDASDKKYSVAKEDGAFYGPKIDILMKDSIGREWQMGTIQLDFQQPLRFGLEYTDKDGKKKTPVVVHRVIYGSLERFIGILIEHLAGNFPFWLSPVQVKVIPVRDSHNEYAKEVFEMLRDADIRAEIDLDDENLGKKVRAAKVEKVPYWIVVGDKEMKDRAVTLESREGEKKVTQLDTLILELTNNS